MALERSVKYFTGGLKLAKPKFTCRNFKKGVQVFHRRFVLAPADNNAVVVKIM